MVFVRAPPLLFQINSAQNQGIVAELLSAKACPTDWRVRNFAVKMETVGAIINNANLAFLHPLSQVEHLILSPRYQPLWQQGRAERHWEQGEQKPLHLQHGNWARGRDTCIPLQDSQLCLLLLEICPKWLTWVYSNLSPAPHCSLLHSGLSKLNAFRNAIISCAFWGQGQYGYYHLEQEALFGSIKHRRVK